MITSQEEEVRDMTSGRPQPLSPDSLEMNKAVFTFEFAPDKWSGLEEWREDICMLFQLAKRLGMNSGRRTMAADYDNLPADYELDWSK